MQSFMRLAERMDFVAILSKMAASPKGKMWLERFAESAPPLVPDAEILSAKALEIIRSHSAEYEESVIREAAQHLKQIGCRYDDTIYHEGCAALNVAMNHIFQQTNAEDPFTSVNGRELQHVASLKKFQQQGLGVIYLCNHSSHVDEFIVDCLLYNTRLGLPLFAAGTNMMKVKSLARVLMVGSYTVQRRGASRSYLLALSSYCRAISEAGMSQGIFLEAWHGGARSRDGSLRYPRRLVTLRSALDVPGDVVVQPVAISYSVVPEDLSLSDRSSGLAWIRGMGFCRSLGLSLLHPKTGLWRAARGMYGRAYATLPKPLLLSELKQAHAVDRGGLSLDEFVALTAMKEIAGAKKVMASQLVARGLSWARRHHDLELKSAVQEELARLKEYHLATFGHEPDLEDFILDNDLDKVIADGLKTLRKRRIIKRKKDEWGLPQVESEAGLSFYATHGDRRLYSPTAKENIVVAGAGDWSFALAFLLGNRTLEEKRYLNASLTLYDSRPEAAAEMGVERSPAGRFSEYRLPKNVFVTHDPPSAFKKANEVIMAPPPEEVAEQVRSLLEYGEQDYRIVLYCPGFEPRTHKLPYQIAKEQAAELGKNPEIYVLAGPVRMDDLVEGRKAVMFLAGHPRGFKDLTHLFNWPPLSIVTCADPLGVQLAGVLAGIYGLWGNFLMRSGELADAALVGHYAAQASAEALRLAQALGAKEETFSAAGPAWIANFAAAGLSGPFLELSGQLAKLARRGDNPALLMEKMHNIPQEEEGGTVYQDLLSARVNAERFDLDLPILQRAAQTLLDK